MDISRTNIMSNRSEDPSFRPRRRGATKPVSSSAETQVVKTTKRRNSKDGGNSKKGESVSNSSVDEFPNGTGCLVCKQDDDHGSLMLCEGCNAEYHIYCLNPPLNAVPKDDWFCAKCIPEDSVDNLEELVSALPIDYTSRFNEICWCQGGMGYGWWPACIFDPCFAIGAARTQATKNLGKKQLVYFFYCAETPFEIKGDSAITSWEMGLAMGYHLGRTAYASGKRRYKQFQLALQAASIEESVPKRHRLKWTFSDSPDRLPSPVRKPTTPKPAEAGKPVNRSLQLEMKDAKMPATGPRRRGRPPNSASQPKKKRRASLSPRARKPSRTDEELAGTMDQEPSGRRALICQVFYRQEEGDILMGFVRLASQKKASFAAVRRSIKEELDNIPVNWIWRFFIPNLGPLSTRQESKFGGMLSFLWKHASREEVGEGTLERPLHVILVDAPK